MEKCGRFRAPACLVRSEWKPASDDGRGKWASAPNEPQSGIIYRVKKVKATTKKKKKEGGGGDVTGPALQLTVKCLPSSMERQ